MAFSINNRRVLVNLFKGLMKIYIYHTNDIHSNFEFVAMVTSYLKANKTESDLYLDSGDFNDLKDFIVQADRGKSALELFSLTGIDLMTFGNNEIDLGKQSLIEIIESDFPIISANVVDEYKNELPGLDKYRIIEKNGVRFLIIGIAPYYDKDYIPGSYNSFFVLGNILTVDPIVQVNEILKEQKGNYDFSILLSHSGLRVDRMLKEHCPDIDLMLGGHTHHVISDGNYSQSGRGQYLGRITLEIKDKEIEIVDNVQLELTQKDPEFLEKLEEKKACSIDKLSKELSLLKELSFDPYSECDLINFICDCLLHDFEADFAIMHHGIAEASLTRPVSKMSLLELLPSKLNPTIYTLEGRNIAKAIWDSFDESLITSSGFGAGFRGSVLGTLGYSYNVSVSFESKKIWINGELLEDSKVYRIVADDYLQRGTGYRSLWAPDKNAIYNGDFIRDLVEKHLMNKEVFDLLKIKRIL